MFSYCGHMSNVLLVIKVSLKKGNTFHNCAYTSSVLSAIEYIAKAYRGMEYAKYQDQDIDMVHIEILSMLKVLYCLYKESSMQCILQVCF